VSITVGITTTKPRTAQIDLPALFSALDTKREAEGKSWREVAEEIGVAPSTLTRLSQGSRPDGDTFVTLTRWLGLSAERFIEGDDLPEEQTVEVIATYLRADKSLKPKTARAIESVLRAAYENLSERSR
jgi:transcriptional regulator with XRE-family HTH domain